MAIELKVVHEKELVEYLKTLGVLDDLINGKVMCRHCKTVITLDNFQSIYPLNDIEIALSCDNLICYVKSLKESKEIHDLE